MPDKYCSGNTFVCEFLEDIAVISVLPETFVIIKEKQHEEHDA